MSSNTYFSQIVWVMVGIICIITEVSDKLFIWIGIMLILIAIEGVIDDLKQK